MSIMGADWVSISIISTCYFVFALQVWAQSSSAALKSKGGKALVALVLVFILCSLTGYLSTFLPQSWWLLREVLHISLAAASLWLVLSNRAAHVAALLGSNDGADS